MNKNQQVKLDQLKQQIAVLLKQIAEASKMQAQYEKEIDDILTQIENALKGE
jgi:hypothetical protein